MNDNKILIIGIIGLVIGIMFAVGTYAYYQNALNGTATGTTLAYTCEGNKESSFVINDIEDIHPGSSEVRNISLTASIYSTATIEVTGYSNMNDSVRPNLALYNDSGHKNRMLADGTNSISTEIYPGVATTIPIYIYWEYGNTTETYSETQASASVKITCSQGYDNRAVNVISRITSKTAGAYRYVGQLVNNYVKFNGNELWRIIGVYGDNLKIIRASNIGSRQYNSSAADGNAWAGSKLETYLNQETSGGYYYSLTQAAKDMIVEGTWLTGANAYNETANLAYKNAQTTQVVRKVGLIALYEYLSSSPSTTKSWLKASSYEWTLTPRLNYSTDNIYIYHYGNIIWYGNVNGSLIVRPVVYLNSNVRIVSGTGESGNPYVLEL